MDWGLAIIHTSPKIPLVNPDDLGRLVGRLERNNTLDELDCRILRELQEDCRTSLQDIAAKVGKSTSTVHYRVKRLEKNGIIEGYYARINSEKLDLDYITLIAIQAKYEPDYYEKIGLQIAKVNGVSAVYYCLGEADFQVLTRSRNRQEFMGILDQLMRIKGVERTKTTIIARVIKEDPRLQI